MDTLMPRKAAAVAEPTPGEVDEELVAASIPDKTGPYWVSPEMAGLWLTRNKENRLVKEGQVQAMARDMANDQWAYTGEAVKFTTTGRLADGQHRLWAIVRSGATVKMLVVLDVPEDSQAYMDTGTKRSAGDALTFRGEANAKILAATARFALQVEGKVLGRTAVSHAEIIDWITDNPEVRRYATVVNKWKARVDMKPSVLTYGLYKIHQIDDEDAQAFLAAIVEMRSLGTGDPIYTFLQRFRTARRNRERTDPIVELGWFYKTWNAMRTRQTLKQLKIPMPGEELVVPK